MKIRQDKVVFLDRDGTLIHDAHYLADARRVRLYQGVARALAALRRAGYKLVVISNQSGIGRGLLKKESVHRVNRRLQELLARTGGVRLNKIYFCPHAPWQGCECRKPKGGLVRRAMREMKVGLQHAFMVGDKICDIEMAKSLGIKGILVLTGCGRRHLSECARLERARQPDFVAGRFAEAARWILKHGG